MAAAANDILIVLADTLGIAVFDELARLAGGDRPPGRIVVITVRRNPRLLAVWRRLPVAAVVDARTEGLGGLATALRIVASGGRYWSRVFSDCCREVLTSGETLRMLTPTEQLVLAMIGDGCDDRVAAEKLAMRPAAVHSVRQRLHKKLGVHRQTALMLRAIELGLVSFCEDGRVARPGLVGMSADPRFRARTRQMRPCAWRCGTAQRCRKCPEYPR